MQAQTVANFLLASEAGLTLVPVINKVWLWTMRRFGVAAAIATCVGGANAGQ